mmetsp:Transcript_3797/g.12008  ORF Transcript_3797/g.12008 Transcript_3797/m.12008 type:complete len:282 (+) Transcript_3797:3620-4465(+)
MRAARQDRVRIRDLVPQAAQHNVGTLWHEQHTTTADRSRSRHAAFVERPQAGKHAQNGRLSRARGAHDDQGLPLLDRKGDIVQQRSSAPRQREPQPPNLELGRAGHARSDGLQRIRQCVGQHQTARRVERLVRALPLPQHLEQLPHTVHQTGGDTQLTVLHRDEGHEGDQTAHRQKCILHARRVNGVPLNRVLVAGILGRDLDGDVDREHAQQADVGGVDEGERVQHQLTPDQLGVVAVQAGKVGRCSFMLLLLPAVEDDTLRKLLDPHVAETERALLAVL